MVERSRLQPKDKPPLRIEAGQTIKPFESISLPQELDYYDPTTVAVIPFTFRGIKGSFIVQADPEAENLSDFITPMGKVRIVKSIDGKDDILEEAPLEINVEFDVKSINQFRELNRYDIQFVINGKQYQAVQDKITAREKDVAIGLTKEGSALIDYQDIKKGKGGTTIMLLPYDAQKIATLEVIFVEKV